MTTAGDQAHAVAVTLQPEPVSVVLDFVEPVRAARDACGLGGKQNSNALTMAPR
jgi:hypothetical protein